MLELLDKKYSKLCINKTEIVDKIEEKDNYFLDIHVKNIYTGKIKVVTYSYLTAISRFIDIARIEEIYS